MHQEHPESYSWWFWRLPHQESYERRYYMLQNTKHDRDNAFKDKLKKA